MATTKAKAAILNKLRAASSGAVDAAPVSAAPAVPTLVDPLEHFVSLLKANHAQVIQCETARLQTVVTDVLREQGATRVIAAERVLAEFPELTQVAEPLPPGTMEDWKEQLFNEVEVGITSAHCALAATGTLVLRPGADEPRSLSLVPPCHILLLREQTLYNDLTHAMVDQRWAEQMPTNMLLVSGPSKTADIQQTLAYGAHGPRTLVVIILPQ
ncbi:LutC/YkgG family protein [Marinimicrobium alkaliphilum]|uniref:LutC/YkgG family protein n=1 Tax=Marinimicrobium alkaliphilum TaxID=2202654 RepID=UPI000DBA077C|nr:lactate utilization protein [Marinimicrobium alkaliphilum]